MNLFETPRSGYPFRVLVCGIKEWNMNAIRTIAAALVMALVLGSAGTGLAALDRGATVYTPGAFDSNIAQPNDD